MKIEMLCNDGSPLGVTAKTLWGLDDHVGVGGSEYLMITLCEEWRKHGHDVILYNNPRERNASCFEQRNINEFDPAANRDVLINFRSPNPLTLQVRGCLKVWLSTDQMSVGDYRAFSGQVDKIVCISQRHVDYFRQTYGIENAIYIDIPVRLEDFGTPEDKINNRIIFTSVPARGLDNMFRIFPKILKEVPDASLVVTSDYRLWGVGPGNEQFILKGRNIPNIEYLGAVNRGRLLVEQLKAELFLYPSNYDELFCVACSEAQAAGCFPITSATGALPTTNMGVCISLDANDQRNDFVFAEQAVAFLKNHTKDKLIEGIRAMAWDRFNPEKILGKWNEKVFNS